jgi:hypothetical protein
MVNHLDYIKLLIILLKTDRLALRRMSMREMQLPFYGNIVV